MKTTLLNFCKKGLLATACFTAALTSNAQQTSIKISSDNDDAEEDISTGSMYFDSSDLELTVDGENQAIGLRFQNVVIPEDAVVYNAYIQFAQDENKNGQQANLTIKAERETNSAEFENVAHNITSRNTTETEIIWTINDAWSVSNEQGIAQQTPNIASLIKEVKDSTDWVSGNTLTFIITGDGNGTRTVESYNGANGGDLTPTLVLQYSRRYEVAISSGNDDVEQVVGVSGLDLSSSDLEIITEDAPQVIGLRFANVMIPTAARIDSAFLQFTVDTKETGTVTTIITPQITNNSKPFTAAEDLMDEANRQFNLSNILIWNVQEMGEPGAQGLTERTPDIASLIQSIVDQRGWASGNALTLGMIDPHWLDGATFPNPSSGQREVESYDGAIGDHSDPSRAPKLIVYYKDAVVAPTGNFPIATGTTWKYDYAGITPETTWTELEYNDAAWKFGASPIGRGHEQSTEITQNEDSAITVYLRQNFIVENGVAAEQDSLIFDIKADDGAIVYLNGVEQFRINMSEGDVNDSTLALSELNNEDEFTRVIVNNNDLVDGVNIIAVEVHQASKKDEDINFDLMLNGKLPPLANGSFPINKYSAWSYSDLGTDLGTEWKLNSTSAINWQYGNGPLGYSNPSATELSFGPDGDNKFITYYFRKTIEIEDITTLPEDVDFGLNVDDGAIVYLNGEEVFRMNMPEGDVDYLTEATDAIAGSDESRYFIYSFATSELPFVNGENVIAVEVHQDRPSSSDLSFDLELREAIVPATPPTPAYACEGEEDPHFSCFTTLQPVGQDQFLNLPETHAFQVLLEEGDTYTKQKPNVPENAGGNNDFTGYVGKEGSSREGIVSINHETSPGGVSIIDIHFNDAENIWIVDSTQGVDFSVVNGTVRNCSGGVTPWGTVITSEESLPTSDADNDGRMDIGWQVEIDPWTKKVRDFGNGPQKLWQAGRISHENIVVANDSLTAYEGEDSGTGSFYKFVADNKTDLSSGTLYALKLDGEIVNGEPTTASGTWIEIPNKTISDQNNTKSLALSLGATVFNGIEDAEINPVTGDIYFTAKGAARTYRFTDNGSTVDNFETYVGGKSYLINDGTTTVEEPWGGGNDNLVFDDRGNLYVLQDGGDNYIWLVGKDHTQEQPQVSVFARFPSGSEPCGMTFTPDFRYAFVSVQHPSSANAAATQQDAADYEATMAQSTTFVVARKEFLGQNRVVGQSELSDLNSDISVYPNPSFGDVTVELALDEPTKVYAEVYDITGKAVAELASGETFSGNQKLTITGLEAGTYILNVRINDQSFAQTIIIK